jgi:predicted molibdopterin-dependent oxidoreductase YjgC
VAYIGALQNTTSRAAAIVVPAAHAVEQDGSFVNRQGRVQRIRRAVNPAGESVPAYVAVDRIGAALGQATGTQMVAATFNAMARAVPAFSGIEFKSLGEAGVLVASEGAPA